MISIPIWVFILLVVLVIIEFVPAAITVKLLVSLWNEGLKPKKPTITNNTNKYPYTYTNKNDDTK